jgi:hypothetical protein
MLFLQRPSDLQPDETTPTGRPLRRPRTSAGRSTLEVRLGLLGVPKGGIWGSQPSRRRKRAMGS